jgi:hypothetical protein
MAALHSTVGSISIHGESLCAEEVSEISAGCLNEVACHLR